MQCGYLMGRAEASLERFQEAVEEWHTCALSYLRYPFPWDETCPGCRRDMETYVRHEHLGMAYRLWGFTAIHQHYERHLKWVHERAEAYRHTGAFI